MSIILDFVAVGLTWHSPQVRKEVPSFLKPRTGPPSWWWGDRLRARSLGARDGATAKRRQAGAALLRATLSAVLVVHYSIPHQRYFLTRRTRSVRCRPFYHDAEVRPDLIPAAGSEDAARTQREGTITVAPISFLDMPGEPAIQFVAADHKARLMLDEDGER